MRSNALRKHLLDFFHRPWGGEGGEERREGRLLLLISPDDEFSTDQRTSHERFNFTCIYIYIFGEAEISLLRSCTRPDRVK